MSLNSKRWCFTLNNYHEKDINKIETWDVKYLVYGKEVGDLGTPHLQGFVIFKKQYRLSGVKKLHSTMHWEIAKGTSFQASDYCKKEDNFFEKGILSEQGKRNDLEEIAEKIKDGVGTTTIAANHPVSYIKFHRGIEQLALKLQSSYNHAHCRGVWIWGPPGTGKSHAARHFDPDLFLKPQNKWWDGYNGQQTVLLDDLDTATLGHHLKIWADRWACTGETKGGTIHLRHKMFIVTSNYRPEHFWPDDESMTEAVMRRFKVIEKHEKNQLIDFLIVEFN
ncbi:MAG: putative viral replication protein [Circoviridae sp.]|nr:MAG: putative viral replication protein [Circoviridae sp.]